MRPPSGELADELAARYVLGLQTYATRRRLEQFLRYDPRLRRRVMALAERLSSIDESIEGIPPRKAVWQEISRRVGVAAPPKHWYQNLGGNLSFWRMATGTMACAAIALSFAMSTMTTRSPAGETFVVVLSDEDQRPVFTASWPQRSRQSHPELRLRRMGGADTDSATAWDLWIVPMRGGKPMYLATVGPGSTQTVQIPPALRSEVDAAEGLAMTVSTRQGVAIDDPTSAWVYRGRCTKL